MCDFIYRYEDICFREISSGAAPWYVVGDYCEAFSDSMTTTKGVVQVHYLTWPKVIMVDVIVVHKDDPPAILYSSVTVFEAIDRCIILVVASNGHHHQVAGRDGCTWDGMDSEERLSVRGWERPLPWAVRESETILVAYPGVKIFKTRNSSGYQIADAVVILSQCTPVEVRGVPKNLVGDPRDNSRL